MRTGTCSMHASRLRSSKSPWTGRCTTSGAASCEDVAGRRFVPWRGRARRRRAAAVTLCTPMAWLTVTSRARRSDHVGHVDRREQHCDRLRVSIGLSRPGRDALEQDRAHAPSSASSSVGAGATAPGAQALDLVGRAVPRAGELEHGVRAVGAPHGANGREQPSGQLVAELEAPPRRDLGLECRQPGEPLPRLIADESRDRRAERGLDDLGHAAQSR